MFLTLSKTDNFLPCAIWTKRNINILFDNELVSLSKSEIFTFFQNIFFFKNKICQASDHNLELYQINNRIDLVYYFKNIRKCRIHLYKKSIYYPEHLEIKNFPVPLVKLKTYPIFSDENELNFKNLCESFCNAINDYNKKYKEKYQ